jgi:hypothetical protein
MYVACAGICAVQPHLSASFEEINIFLFEKSIIVLGREIQMAAYKREIFVCLFAGNSSIGSN